MIIPYISKKQREILKLIYIFRFLTRVQIQKFLKHKDKKTINLWLKDLVAKKYLKRIYSTKFGENTKPAIYYSGLNAIRFFKTQEYSDSAIIRKLYKEDTREQDFIDRSILLADIGLDLIKQSSKNKTFPFTTASEYVKEDNAYHFLTELKDHAPNLVIEEKVTKAKRTTKNYYLLSIIDSNLPRYRVRRRIRNYIVFYFQNSWEEHISKQFPIIRFVSPTKAEMIRTKRFTRKVLEENQADKLSIQLTFVDKVNEFGITADIWEEVAY